MTEPVVKKRLLTIYTGGTIGMVPSPDGLVPGPIRELVAKFPMLNDEEYEFTEEEQESFPYEPLALPVTSNNFRILYCIMPYDPLLDSSNMDMDDWATMASDIEKYYQDFDGFVILHGTDTMCYTASALSFMLKNLGKTVIITGSQVPLMDLRSDGRDNLVDTLVVCGENIIPEVCILFNSQLFRGNRCCKLDSLSLDAFGSPNVPPLAVLEIDIKVDWDSVHRAGELDKFEVQKMMNSNVGILRLFPGITHETVRAFLQPPMQGVVLLSFGSGNVPDQNQAFLDELKAASERGVIIINCSQCSRGHVNDTYAAGGVLLDHGVIQGADMTPEAALAKVSYVLCRDELNIEAKKEWLVNNQRGELTVLPEDPLSSNELVEVNGFVPAFIKALNTSSAKEKQQVLQYLMPQLMCSYAAVGDKDRLLQLREQGGDFSLPNYDGRSPLHVACSKGNLAIVRMLLEHGAPVHLKDRFGHTPLIDAIRCKHVEIIKLLVQTGAHMASTSKAYVASEICQAAAEDDVESLKAWQVAGVDLNMKDYHRCTPLDMAKQHSAKSSMHFLTQCVASGKAEH